MTECEHEFKRVDDGVHYCRKCDTLFRTRQMEKVTTTDGVDKITPFTEIVEKIEGLIL